MGEAADVTRRAFALTNAYDTEGMAAIADPEIEFHDVPEIPGSKTYHGREGLLDWMRTVREASDDLRFEIWELEENGEAVMVETSAEMHGKASGAEVGWRFWTVWRVRDGLITYHHGYSSREDARKDFEKG